MPIAAMRPARVSRAVRRRPELLTRRLELLLARIPLPVEARTSLDTCPLSMPVDREALGTISRELAMASVGAARNVLCVAEKVPLPAGVLALGVRAHEPSSGRTLAGDSPRASASPPSSSRAEPGAPSQLTCTGCGATRIDVNLVHLNDLPDTCCAGFSGREPKAAAAMAAAVASPGRTSPERLIPAAKLEVWALSAAIGAGALSRCPAEPPERRRPDYKGSWPPPSSTPRHRALVWRTVARCVGPLAAGWLLRHR